MLLDCYISRFLDKYHTPLPIFNYDKSKYLYMKNSKVEYKYFFGFDRLYDLMLDRKFNKRFDRDLDKKVYIASLVRSILKNGELNSVYDFYFLWYSFYLLPYKLLSADEIYTAYKLLYSYEPNNANIVLNFARVYAVWLYNIEKDNFKKEMLTFKALRLMEKLINYLGEADIYWYIWAWYGAVYRHHGDLKTALKLLDKSILVNKNEPILYQLAYYWKLGVLYDIGYYDKFIEFYKEIKNISALKSFRLYKPLVKLYLYVYRDKNKAKFYLEKLLVEYLRENKYFIIQKNNKIIKIWLLDLYEGKIGNGEQVKWMKSIESIMILLCNLYRKGNVNIVNIFWVHELCCDLYNL